jgi:hypothetical protein
LFEQLHEELAGEPRHRPGFAKRKPYPESTKETFPRWSWFARAFGVVRDAGGKIAWGGSDIGDDPMAVVPSEAVSDAHLARLRCKGVAYVFAGRSQLDLGLTLDILNRGRLLLKGEGGTNSALLRAGLVDELDGSCILPCAAQRVRKRLQRRRSARSRDRDDASEQSGAGRRCNVAAVPHPECKWPVNGQ